MVVCLTIESTVGRENIEANFRSNEIKENCMYYPESNMRPIAAIRLTSSAEAKWAAHNIFCQYNLNKII